ncbi:MAG: flagellar hook-basal body protein [Bacillota bacterium]|jgi:flagellar basal-body rod protein FlgF|nr:flagellar hook-basal body protein [Clostridia bacterium]
MIRGLYSSASGMLVNQRKSDIIEGNIENLNRPGYREISQGLTSFPQILTQRIGPSPIGSGEREVVNLGVMGTGVRADRIYYSNKPGLIRQTDNPTDLAVNGEGYFVIQTLDGERYTRNGHFVLDPSRRLRTAGGNLVLGEYGPIGPLPEQFKVQPDGTIINQETNNVIDRLRIVSIPNNQIRQEGDTTLYQALTEPVPLERERVRISQGCVEESNVDLTGQMVKMIEAARFYQSNQKVIQIIDNLLQKTVNEIGRV